MAVTVSEPCDVIRVPANGVTWDICNVFLKLTVLIEIVSIYIYLKYNEYKKRLNLLFSAEFKV